MIGGIHLLYNHAHTVHERYIENIFPSLFLSWYQSLHQKIRSSGTWSPPSVGICTCELELLFESLKTLTPRN